MIISILPLIQSPTIARSTERAHVGAHVRAFCSVGHVNRRRVASQNSAFDYLAPVSESNKHGMKHDTAQSW